MVYLIVREFFALREEVIYMDWYSKYYNSVTKYFSKHVLYNSFIHVIAGAGIGIILARPIDGSHPVQLGLILIGVSVLGHLIPGIMGKK
jgi:hypothetical protein